MLRKILVPRCSFTFYNNIYHRASIVENDKEIIYDTNVSAYGQIVEVLICHFLQI
jgi:hypothetical protein